MTKSTGGSKKSVVKGTGGSSSPSSKKTGTPKQPIGAKSGPTARKEPKAGAKSVVKPKKREPRKRVSSSQPMASLSGLPVEKGPSGRVKPSVGGPKVSALPANWRTAPRVSQPTRVLVPRPYTNVARWSFLGMLFAPSTTNVGEQEALDQMWQMQFDASVSVPPPQPLVNPLRGGGSIVLIPRGTTISLPIQAPAPLVVPEKPFTPEVEPTHVPRPRPVVEPTPTGPETRPAPVRRPAPKRRKRREYKVHPSKEPRATFDVKVTPMGDISLSLRIGQAPKGTSDKPRKKDRKSNKAYGLFLFLLENTYGAVDEVREMWGIFAWNLYGASGEYAIALENGDTAQIFKGYLDGTYRLDFQGFLEDFASNMIEDAYYGITSDALQKLVNRFGYSNPWGIQSEMRMQRYLRGEKSDAEKSDWRPKPPTLREINDYFEAWW